MADVQYCERRFVECFVRKDMRDRYLTFLKGQKHHRKILDRLNHSLDYESTLARELPAESRTVSGLVAVLRSFHVSDTCYFMADGNELDGRERRLELGAEELLDNYWGAVLICPPKPVAVYKEEDIGRLFLFADEAATANRPSAGR